MSSQISVFHRSKIIVNQNEWKFNSLKVGAGGILSIEWYPSSSSLLEN